MTSRRAGGAELPVDHRRAHRRLGLGAVVGNDDALAGGEAVGFDHDRKAELAAGDGRERLRRARSQTTNRAVGIACRAMKCLAKTFEHSSAAPRCEGPTIGAAARRGTDRRRRARAAPRARRRSGRRAHARPARERPSGSVEIDRQTAADERQYPDSRARRAPRDTSGPGASRQASACSRPPPPRTRTCTRSGFYVEESGRLRGSGVPRRATLRCCPEPVPCAWAGRISTGEGVSNRGRSQDSGRRVH